MEIRPILSALLRNRAGAILVALQIAITLAIVVNAMYVTQQRVEKIGRPTGIDDQNIFCVQRHRLRKGLRFPGMVREDMALLRQMPGIVDAAPIQQVPLSGSGSSTGFFSLPDKKGEESPANYYATDEHGVNTLGMKLSAGATFDPTRSNTGTKDSAGLSADRHHQPGTRERAVPEAERPRQDLLRRPEQAIQDRRRHRTHARLLGGLGQGGSRDAHAGGGPGSRHAVHRARAGPAKSTAS